jgi:hypothetical protein
MPELLIEQAIVLRGRSGWEIVARSPGWEDAWQSEIELLCDGFGQPPIGEHLPICVFAQPLGRDRAAVVQAAADGDVPILRFRILTVPNAVYAGIGDPFALSERFPPPWDSRIALPSLAWTNEIPDRSLERVRRVLQEADSPTLLGAAQAIVDGGRVIFERPFPAPDLLRRLWTLLPDNTRAEVWPASFAFSSDLDWHAVVVPHYDPEQWPGYVTESQAGDYPEGRYELNLQIAVETENQIALDRLFARRTSRQMLQLALTILVFAVLAAILLKAI